MDKNDKGFGFGAKTDSERKHDELREQKGPIKSGWGLKKSKAKEATQRPPVEHRPCYDVQEIKIADIKVRGKRRASNPDKLKELAASISILRLQSPITVRLVKRDRGWGKTETELVLVCGLHRLEAMKQLGKKTIPCVVMTGSKRIARIWEISENLHRAELTSLEYDEQVAEWVRLTQADQRISGQNVQKKGRGRRKGGISEAARKLPVQGKTQAAKRKNVESALKVDSIFPEAKDAIKKAGLDKNRSKLLKVAAEKTLDAQLAKVRELTARKPETKEKRGSFWTKQKTTKADSKTPPSAEDQKALEHLIEHWNKAHELKRAFIEAPPNVREQFITKIRG